MIGWLQENDTLLTWLGISSLVVFLGSLIGTPMLIARIPTDFFRDHRRDRDLGVPRHTRTGWILLTVKNATGVALVLAGVMMLLLPGQGVLTILIGMLLIDFPGRHALVVRLARLPKVRRAMDWIRRRYGRPPLEFDE